MADLAEKCREFFGRNDVTDQEWEQLLEEIKEENNEYMKGYYKRLEEYDYLVPNNPWAYSYYYDYVAQKGCAYVYALADLEGNLVNAKTVQGNYGTQWLIKKEDGSVEWVNWSVADGWNKKQRHYNKKGYQMVQVLAKVRVNKYGDVEPNLAEPVSIEVLAD